MTHGVYLYGILPPPGPSQDLELAGLDQQPVRTHELSGFTFLYSEALQPRYLASRRNLMGHERVLEELMHRGYRSLLPLRFGLVIEEWTRVQEQLVVPHGEGLRSLMAGLEGHREVSVKVSWDGEAQLLSVLAERPELRSRRDALAGRPLAMDEVIAIGQALEAALEERKQSIIARFRGTLDALASRVVENDPLGEGMIYNAAYLIPWDSEPRFGERVEALDRQFEDSLRIRYNQFTAPFNFARLE